jgi:hypothetical protein
VNFYRFTILSFGSLSGACHFSLVHQAENLFNSVLQSKHQERFQEAGCAMVGGVERCIPASRGSSWPRESLKTAIPS